MAQAPSRIKAFSVYFSGKKVGVLESATLTMNGNDEDHVTSDGWSASDGTVTSQLKCGTVTPVDGFTSFLTDAIVNKLYLSVQIGVVDGQIWAIQMRCWQAEYTSDPKTGSLKGSFEFHGGAPDKQ